MSEQGQTNPRREETPETDSVGSLGEQYIKDQDLEALQADAARPQSEQDKGPKKLSAAEKLDLWERKKQLHIDKSEFHHKQAAHYAKKIGALRRMAAELGVEIV